MKKRLAIAMVAALLAVGSGPAQAKGKAEYGGGVDTCGSNWDNGKAGTNDGASVCCPAGKIPTSSGCSDGDQTPAAPGVPGWDDPGNPGPSTPEPGNGPECRAQCLQDMQSCNSDATEFGDWCEGYFAVAYARDQCEEGKAITTAAGGKFVTPAGWKWGWSFDNYLPCEPGQETKSGAVCELHWLDPDNCLVGWLYGVAGESTTKHGIDVSTKNYTSQSDEQTISVNPQDGLLKSCESDEFAALRSCAQEKVKCTKGCKN